MDFHFMLLFCAFFLGVKARPPLDIASTLTNVTSDLGDVGASLGDVAIILQDVTRSLQKVARALENHQPEPTAPSSTEAPGEEAPLTTGGVDTHIYRHKHIPSVSLNLRIIGGTDSTHGEFPYLASIQVTGALATNHVCGGVLVSTSDVLTLASCVASFQPAQLSVHVGEYDLSTHEGHEQLMAVRAKTLHPDYSDTEFTNDIAMLHLAEAVTLSDHVSVMEVEASGPTDGAICTMAGWGITEVGGEMAATLSKFPVAVLPDSTCKDAYKSYGTFRYDPPSMACGGDAQGNNADFCQGDIGGPLVCPTPDGDQLGGLASFGKACGEGHPAVYTQVSHFHDWILEVIEVQQRAEDSTTNTPS